MGRVPSRDLLPRVLEGDVAAIARLLSRAEAADPECRETLGEVYARAGKSSRVACASSGTRSASSPSIPRARTRAARSWAIASA